MTMNNCKKVLDALNKLNNYAELPADHRWVSTVRHYINEQNSRDFIPLLYDCRDVLHQLPTNWFDTLKSTSKFFCNVIDRLNIVLSQQKE